MTNVFKVGDKVRRKKEHLTRNAWPQGRKVLEVRGISGYGELLFSGTANSWNPEYFEKVKARDYVADHARRTLRKAGLTAEQAAKFVKNCQTLQVYWPSPETPVKDGKVDLSKLSRELPAGVAPARLVADAFRWNESPEGNAYWVEVHKALCLKGRV